MRAFPVPTKKLLIIFSLSLALIILGLFKPIFLKMGVVFDFSLMLVVFSDIFQLYKEKKLEFSVLNEKPFSIGREGDLTIKVVNNGNLSYTADFMFDLPRFWSQIDGIMKATLIRNSTVDITCRLLPLRRGRYNIEKLYIRLQSSLGLFSLYEKETLNYQADVYPDFRELKEYFLMSRNNRLFEMGIHKNRYKGRGTELESLREYTKDDDARFIDWKVSARINKPVTKVFQMESMNDVVFVLDCGRLMTSEEENLSSLDLAINALLVLSHVSVSMGDRIRIITFSDRIKGDFIPPRGGNPMRRIINFITPVQPEFVESNYPLIFSHLRKTVKKRSLIIFVSDIIDDINYNMFKTNFTHLAKRNAILFMLLRDKLLQQETDREAKNTTDIFSITAARSMYLNRSKAITKLRQSGINVLDVLPEHVTARLVDKYMQLKAANKI